MTAPLGGGGVAWTPGPWLVHSTNRLIVKAGDAFGDAAVEGNKVEADFIPLALLRDPVDGFSEDETLANGFLIAAAPELYEALEGLFAGGFVEAGAIEQSQWAQELEARLKPCRDALAKARGDQ